MKLRTRGEGVQKSENFPDVINGSPLNPVSQSVDQAATHICESSNSSKQSKEEIAREEIVAGGGGSHGHRQQVQSPKFGFDAEVASASAAAAAAALLVTKGSVLLSQFPVR